MEVTKILNTSNSGLLKPEDLRDFISHSLDADKATDIEIFNIDKNTALADYIVVATGQSSQQVIRLAEKLVERLGARGRKSIPTEGMRQGDWVIVDAGEVIVHLFRPEVRSFYNIEKIWSSHSAPEPIRNDPGQKNVTGTIESQSEYYS